MTTTNIFYQINTALVSITDSLSIYNFFLNHNFFTFVLKMFLYDSYKIINTFA